MWNNNVDIVGNLGADPEIKSTSTGGVYASFSVAVNRKSGDNVYTDWVPVRAWGDLAEAVKGFLFKGTRVRVNGRYTTSSYTDKNGNKAYFTCVTADGIFLQLFKDGVGIHSENRNSQEPQPEANSYHQGGGGNFQSFGEPVQKEPEYVNDDMPF